MSEQPDRLSHWKRRQDRKKLKASRLWRETVAGAVFFVVALGCVLIGLHPAQFLSVFGAEPLAAPTEVLKYGMTLFTTVFVLSGVGELWRALDTWLSLSAMKDRIPAVDAREVHTTTDDSNDLGAGNRDGDLTDVDTGICRERRLVGENYENASEGDTDGGGADTNAEVV